jgi:hypothetical protein
VAREYEGRDGQVRFANPPYREPPPSALVHKIQYVINGSNYPDNEQL